MTEVTRHHFLHVCTVFTTIRSDTYDCLTVLCQFTNANLAYDKLGFIKFIYRHSGYTLLHYVLQVRVMKPQSL